MYQAMLVYSDCNVDARIIYHGCSKWRLGNAFECTRAVH